MDSIHDQHIQTASCQGKVAWLVISLDWMVESFQVIGSEEIFLGVLAAALLENIRRLVERILFKIRFGFIVC